MAGCGGEENTEVTQSEPEFNEPFRPQYHFTPPAMWMNDPNGMVYHDGEYHLFYQHYPDSTVWGPMHWGHAVSEDLVHWEHLPVAIEPDEHGWIFSGSAVFDADNTSGLATEDNPPLVAIYTYHDPVGAEAKRDDFQTQGIAYSTDRGRNWLKYEGNPVLKNPGIRDFRDPKVSWVDDKWIMSLAVKDRISFYSSPNLIDWTHESDFNPSWAAYGGVWECPDLFPLTTAGGEEKWVLFVSINPGGPNGGSATQYFIGDFDGKQFHVESREVKWLDYGADNYAGVTWSNVPEEDGRRLFIGWMSNWTYANIVPTENWRSANTVPRNLELVETNGDYLVASRPVKELDMLRNDTHKAEGSGFSLDHELVEILLTPNQEKFKVEIGNEKGERVVLEKNGDQLVFDRSQSGITDFHEAFSKPHTAPLNGLKIKDVRIYLDRSSVEVFINDGELVMTEVIFPTEHYNRVSLSGFSADSQVHYLNSIW
ncbi:glycoside hydrolase family 32 protein [Negadavirga shengliensis]|uniref:Glycoside hydrolase family 32 protein n=1 Tax=Negadavirga shengliensis TaxID=1389218 RepID=A0ABV9SV48_9BACT